jgi:hypothetical protein
LAYEHFNKKGLPIDLTRWRTVAYLVRPCERTCWKSADRQSGPHQDNDYDCGVATCLALAEFSRWKEMKDPEQPLFNAIEGGRQQIRAELAEWLRAT